MSKFTKRCLPFYKLLKKDKIFGWNEECEKAFIQLKEYLSSLPILTRPKVEETIFLYIATSKAAVGIMLIVERNGVQKPIFLY